MGEPVLWLACCIDSTFFMGTVTLTDIGLHDKDLRMAIHALLPQGIALALTASMGLVIVLDASRYTIPNTLNGGLVLFTAFAALVLPFSRTALLAAAVVLGWG